MMSMRELKWALASLALPLLAGWGSAAEPAVNQDLADRLANVYQTSGELSRYHVNIETNDGIVTLTGKVSSELQRQSLIGMTRRTPGVAAVNDLMAVDPDAGVVTVGFEPRPLNVSADEAEQPIAEPEPMTSFAGGVAPYSDSPVLPAYSWPAYTPYNNFASMAYQTQYPSGAWPFIGPPHPYPMIPSGWRRVSLKWRGGYWWMKFHAH